MAERRKKNARRTSYAECVYYFMEREKKKKETENWNDEYKQHTAAHKRLNTLLNMISK